MVVGGGNNDKLKSKGGLTVDKTTTTAHVSSNNYFHHLWAKILRQQKKKRKGLWEAHFWLLTNVMHSVFCVRSICFWQQMPESTHPHLSMHCGHSVSVLCALGLVAIWFAFAHTHNQETPSTWPTWWAFSVKVGYGCLRNCVHVTSNVPCSLFLGQLSCWTSRPKSTSLALNGRKSTQFSWPCH